MEMGERKVPRYQFSVIVPVYNVEAYLERCVLSLTRQERGRSEILLVDDGSTDQSGGLCDRYAREYDNVRAFHKTNGGLSSARNYGIDRAEGEYVLFVDSDDYVEETMCQKLAVRLSACPDADMVSFDGSEESETGRRGLKRISAEGVSVKSGREFLLNCYRTRNLNVQAWIYAYRKAFLDEKQLRFKEGILHEDVEFTPRALLNAGRILTVPDSFYHYVIREGSISTKKNKEKNIRDLFRTLEAQCELAETQDSELRRWMKNEALNSCLNMVQEAEMYRPEYRKLLNKAFLRGKAATGWNRFRAALCYINVRWYCGINDLYKRLREKI